MRNINVNIVSHSISKIKKMAGHVALAAVLVGTATVSLAQVAPQAPAPVPAIAAPAAPVAPVAQATPAPVAAVAPAPVASAVAAAPVAPAPVAAAPVALAPIAQTDPNATAQTAAPVDPNAIAQQVQPTQTATVDPNATAQTYTTTVAQAPTVVTPVAPAYVYGYQPRPYLVTPYGYGRRYAPAPSISFGLRSLFGRRRW
jgi:hypothetical protein